MAQAQLDQREELLKRIYYDINSEGSFGGAKRLLRIAKQSDPSIELVHVNDWLQSQDAYTNFKQKRRRFQRLPIIVDRIDEQWQADLMDMSFWTRKNGGIKYLLVAVDVLSRFAWVQPCKDKTGDSIKSAFMTIFAEGRKPEKLQTDQGREFKNARFESFCSENGIRFFTTTDDSVKCAIAERFIRTLRNRIYRFVYWKNTQRYIDDLQNIVKNYNNSYHRTIKTSPSSVNRENQQDIIRTIQQTIKEADLRKAKRFKVGDDVKIPFKPENFEKGAVQQWTDEVFKVRDEKITPQKYIYKVKDQTGEDISSIFYPEELQKVKYNPDAPSKIEKIIRKQYDKQKKQYKYFVKWQGWPEKFNSWIYNPEKI